MKNLTLILLLFGSCYANSTFYIKGAGGVSYSNWESNLSNINTTSQSWLHGKRQPAYDFAIGAFSYNGIYGSPASFVSEIGVKRIEKVSFEVFDTVKIRERIYTTFPYAALGLSQHYGYIRTTLMVGLGRRTTDIDNTLMSKYNWNINNYIAPIFSVSIDRSIIQGTGFGLGYQLIPGRSYLVGTESTSREFIPMIQQGQILFYYHI